jgi:fumarate hydratase class II
LAQKSGWLEGGSAAVMPIKCFMDSADLLSRTMDSFANLCIKGIEANVDHCADLAEQSLLCAKYIEQQCGKDAAGKVFDTALAKGCSVKQAALLLKDQLPGLDFEIFGHLFKGL